MNNLVKLKSGDGNIVITDEMIIKKTDEFIKDYVLPANYNYNNAVKSFCLAIPDVKGIENATPRSLMLAAQEYVSKGYDISKRQCSLIMYGNQLKVQPQYFGNVALAKKTNPTIKDITSSAIYEGDNIQLTKISGRTHIDHTTSFENMRNKIVGAYATVLYNDNTDDSEIMTIEDIEKSWSMSRTGTATHKKFPSQMARKTVLNKLCTSIINSSVEGDSPNYQQDEFENYEERIKNQDNIDYDNAISMDEPVEETMEEVAKEEPTQEDSLVYTVNMQEPKQEEVKQEVPVKEEKVVDVVDSHIDNSKTDVQESEDDVIARFTALNEQKEEAKVEEQPAKEEYDDEHCCRCGTKLPPISVEFYRTHKDKERLCWNCSKSK